MPDYTIRNEAPALMDGNIVQDYLAFSKESPLEVEDKIRNFRKYTSGEYHDLKDAFYGDSKFYIYDILGGNPSTIERANLLNQFIPNIVRLMRDHPGQRFADFGGGVGAVCSIMAECSTKQVTYIDLDAYMTDFAQYRFHTHGQNVNMVIIPEDDFTLPESYYDVIFTDAVWEHLPPEKQIDYATKLTNYIPEDGLFVMLIDLSGHTPEMPMHFDVNVRAVHDAIADNGLTCLYGQNNFASVWVRG